MTVLKNIQQTIDVIGKHGTELPESIKRDSAIIIHSSSLFSGGVGSGLAQIPTADNAIITPIQIGMITQLGRVFDLSITEAGIKSIIAAGCAEYTGRTVSQLIWGWMPVIGNVTNAITATGLTEVIGWLAYKNFEIRWNEDMKKGKLDGIKEGYNKASKEYEDKLIKQGELFTEKIQEYEDLV